MMSNKAVRGILYLLIGVCLAQCAMLAKLSVATVDRYHRTDAVRDFGNVISRIDDVESNQKLIMARQATTMKKLNLPFPSDDPATQP